ncbi:hypothetical protein B0H10DRAFT_1961089 [Mycena sp. CBHHK59/15]|nr:hypothetical protein B0H10DRAFT_1961089 [Mycena sp. CBHHK59/15]
MLLLTPLRQCLHPQPRVGCMVAKVAVLLAQCGPDTSLFDIQDTFPAVMMQVAAMTHRCRGVPKPPTKSRLNPPLPTIPEFDARTCRDRIPNQFRQRKTGLREALASIAKVRGGK